MSNKNNKSDRSKSAGQGEGKQSRQSDEAGRSAQGRGEKSSKGQQARSGGGRGR